MSIIAIPPYSRVGADLIALLPTLHREAASGTVAAHAEPGNEDRATAAVWATQPDRAPD